ncbi:uncharacterized protein LOC119593495 [Penaeus monodon]|uniref:uncharacterized protein LOC119593495 n=1 Tax=Penaeus monodon TaxID=6687 RepID=UPI0018A7A9C2|nr:uncharacterized protein LOC119593495 [Penaeus monodon]
MRTHDRYYRGRGGLVSPERDPERDCGDSVSDIESVVSAFSTQSERPRGTRKFSRRHLSSLKSQSHAQSYDVTFDDPTILSDLDRDYDLGRNISCSLLDTVHPLGSPLRRAPVLRRSLSMGVSPAVSRSAPSLSVRPRQQPRTHLIRSNTMVSAPPPPRTRHCLQKSHSLGENDKHWLLHHDPDLLMDHWDVRDQGHRARSRSLTRDDLVLRSHPKKTVTYEDEVLSKHRVQGPARISRSSLSIDKSVPYESDLEVREHVSDTFRRKPRAQPEREVYSDAQNSDISNGETNRSLYRRRSSARLVDGHSAGTYYGYDSEYSGAETEVFLSDRSLDRSCSLEHVEQRKPEIRRDIEKRPIDQPRRMTMERVDEFFPTSIQSVREGSSQTLPRARRHSGITQPRKTFMRANTESSLLSGPSRNIEREVMWRPSREDPEALYRVPLRESSVSEPPLEAARSLHSNPSLAHVFDGSGPPSKYEAYGSDEVFAPVEQRRQEPPRPVDERGRYPSDAPHEYDRNYRRDSRLVPEAEGYIDQEERYRAPAIEDKDRYPDRGHSDDERYRNKDRYRDFGPPEKERYREQIPMEKERYIEQVPADIERCIVQGPVDQERYRDHELMEKDRYVEQVPRGLERYREPIVVEQERFRDEDPYRDQNVGDHDRYREQGAIEKDRYRRRSSCIDDRPRASIDQGRYREMGDLEQERYRENIGQERFREHIEQERYREHPEQDRYLDPVEHGRGYQRGPPPPPPQEYNGQVDDRRCYDSPRRDGKERYDIVYDDREHQYGEQYEHESPRMRDPRYQQDPRSQRFPPSGHDPNFAYHDPHRPHDRRDTASHQHTPHPHNPAHAHAHPTNTIHAQPSNTHQTYADPSSYSVAETDPMYPADTDIVVDDENPDQDRPLTPRVRHSSSVSINEHPEYFEFDANSPPSTEPRADADVDPSSNPASEFSQRETAYGSMGVNYGGTSKRGQLGRSRSTSEVPETEKTEKESVGEGDEKGEKGGEGSEEGVVVEEAVEGNVEGDVEGGEVEEGCEEAEVMVEEECVERECSVEGSSPPPEHACGSSNHDSLDVEKLDGSLSDSAAGLLTVEGKERRRATNGKQSQNLGLSKKSSSTSKLSDTEGGRKRSTSGVQRSQEVIPSSQARLVKQPSKESTDGSMNSISSEGSSRVPSMRLGTDGQLSEFIEGLGPGQLVGRQVLAAPALGDIQLSMCDRKNKLEVEVIRARGLQCKTGARILPAPYVKVYLVDGKKCVAKAKTATARRTLDPLYQQQLIFHERYQGCVLQVTVWGDYGRMEGRKVFMGLAQIMLDDLDLSNIVIGWYKLFGTSSLVSLPALTRRGSMASLDSFG